MSEDSKIRRAQYAEKAGEVVLREHEYDGIQEYDQKLPNWWLVIFIAANLFFFVWWFSYYQLGLFQTDAVRIEQAMAQIEKNKKKALENVLASLNNEKILNEWATDAAHVAAGKEAYMANCIACHGNDLRAAIDIGGGKTVALPGLPLNDGKWKYGAQPMMIFSLINDGTPAESSGHNGMKMEAWGQRMSALTIAQITSFLVSENMDDFGSDATSQSATDSTQDEQAVVKNDDAVDSATPTSNTETKQEAVSIDDLNDEKLLKQWAVDAKRIAAGKQAYATNCVACHGADLKAKIDLGGGKSVPLPGLSLLDGEWKYGAQPMAIFKLIYDGTPADSSGHNGMKMDAWGQRMSVGTVAEITAYLLSENMADFE